MSDENKTVLKVIGLIILGLFVFANIGPLFTAYWHWLAKVFPMVKP